jgi:hypothetical protein
MFMLVFLRRKEKDFLLLPHQNKMSYDFRIYFYHEGLGNLLSLSCHYDIDAHVYERMVLGGTAFRAHLFSQSAQGDLSMGAKKTDLHFCRRIR